MIKQHLAQLHRLKVLNLLLAVKYLSTYYGPTFSKNDFDIELKLFACILLSILLIFIFFRLSIFVSEIHGADSEYWVMMKTSLFQLLFILL